KDESFRCQRCFLIRDPKIDAASGYKSTSSLPIDLQQLRLLSLAPNLDFYQPVALTTLTFEMSPSIPDATYKSMVSKSRQSLDRLFADMPRRQPFDVMAVRLWARGFLTALVSRRCNCRCLDIDKKHVFNFVGSLSQPLGRCRGSRRQPDGSRCLLLGREVCRRLVARMGGRVDAQFCGKD